MSNNQNKISDLETLIAHQDKQIQELNEVVTRQWQEIDALKQYVQRTKAKIEELELSIGDLGNEKEMSVTEEAAANKPPHY
jgi:SlyX protein